MQSPAGRVPRGGLHWRADVGGAVVAFALPMRYYSSIYLKLFFYFR